MFLIRETKNALSGTSALSALAVFQILSPLYHTHLLYSIPSSGSCELPLGSQCSWSFFRFPLGSCVSVCWSILKSKSLNPSGTTAAVAALRLISIEKRKMSSAKKHYLNWPYTPQETAPQCHVTHMKICTWHGFGIRLSDLELSPQPR